MIVDAHTHAVPLAFLTEVRSGRSRLNVRIDSGGETDLLVHADGYRFPLHEVFTDPSARLGFMDGRGVDRAVVSIAPPLQGYELEPADGVAHARFMNDAMAELTHANERLDGLATLPLQDPAAAVDELTRAADLGLQGVQVGANVRGVPLDDDRFRDVLTAAEHLGMPFLIHPTFTGPLPGLEEYYLTNVCGNPWQTCVCASRLILSGTLDRHPELAILLAHAGGHLPYQIGRIDHAASMRDDVGRCRDRPSDYLRRFLFDSLAYSPHALDYLIGLVGADRVMYGSDAPFDMDGGSLQDQLGGIELDPSDHALIAGGNAHRVFGLSHG